MSMDHLNLSVYIYMSQPETLRGVLFPPDTWLSILSASSGWTLVRSDYIIIFVSAVLP
jgi:hypothetical protein